MKTMRQIALDAAKVLQEEGWCQGQFRTWNEDGDKCTGYCAIGAIRQATGFYSLEVGPEGRKIRRLGAGAAATVVQKITDIMEEKDGVGSTSPLVDFNDRPGRTKDDVIGLLEGCAELLPDVEPHIDEYYLEDL